MTSSCIITVTTRTSLDILVAVIKDTIKSNCCFSLLILQLEIQFYLQVQLAGTLCPKYCQVPVARLLAAEQEKARKKKRHFLITGET